MKEFFLTLVFIFLFCLPSFSQVSKIEYYTYTKNTVDTTGRRTYTLFNNNKSLFVWRSESQLTKTSRNFSSDQKLNTVKVYNDTIGKRVFNKYSSDSLILNESFLDENYIVLDVKIKNSWSLIDEFKTIANFNCQKASISFRGRQYIAWFTTEIPVPTGPWKLHGLPGLIMEAYDINNEVNFLFKSYSNKWEDESIVINVKGEIPISIQEFVEISDGLRERLIKEALSKLPRGSRAERVTKVKRNGMEIKYEWEK